MANKIGTNIYRYRKEKGYTQSQLANMVGVTFQAISKWETDGAVPDLERIVTLADALGVGVDSILGHSVPSSTEKSIYDDQYKKKEFYWGTQPSELGLRVIEHMPPWENPKLLEVGSREGVNALFFARNGYHVTAVEMSSPGVEKGEKLLDKWGVSANFICADIGKLFPKDSYDVIFCDDVLHTLPQNDCHECIENFRENTAPGGINVISVPVAKPYITKKNSLWQTEWHSGDIFRKYCDWEILECSETKPIILNKNKYACVYNIVVAKKPL